MNKNENYWDQIFLNEDESGLVNLLDKYIKSNNNFLPLQAYLDYLETNSLNLFSSISISPNCKTINAHNSATLINLNDKTEPKTIKDEFIIAQKLYKIVISIDYSPQVTNLDFIQKRFKYLAIF